LGIAGLAAFLAGTAGVASGWTRSEVIIGGDVGNELAFVFTLVTYIPVKYFALMYVGRWVMVVYHL
jgi:hypothetical protein